jgi:outer membrane protein assembly factor BamB
MNYRMAVAGLLLSLGATEATRADDWPQWMGPKRDNVWREEGILEKFPKGGPKVLWRAPLAGGYSGPAVVGDKLYITDYTTKDKLDEGNFNRKESSGVERVACLDATSGKQIWEHKYPVKYGISYPNGPRCTPTVDGDKVYVLGAEGNLFAFEAATGKIVWQKELKTEYKTKSALWGYASHPLVDGNKLICVVGGEGSHTVAFDKSTGKELWRSQDSVEQGYVPPSIIEYAGVRQLLLPRPDGISSVDPETGKRHWVAPYSATNGSIIMTPILIGEYLYVAGYQTKNLLLKLGKDKPTAEVVWQDKRKHGLSPVNVQPFAVGDVIYGYDESGLFYAVKIPTGERLWETSQPVSEKTLPSATAFIVKNGENFWFFTEKGDLVIGKLSPKGYEEIDRAHVIEPTATCFGRPVVWSNPAYANKKAYIRNDKEIICLDLSK